MRAPGDRRRRVGLTLALGLLLAGAMPLHDARAEPPSSRSAAARRARPVLLPARPHRRPDFDGSAQRGPTLRDPRRGGLARGKLLVATQQLTGPFFAESVILLLDYGPTGAVGVIVNRPTPITLRSVLPDLPGLARRDDPIFLGGPVEAHNLIFLVRGEKPPPNSRLILPGVHASGSAAALEHALAGKIDRHALRAIAGYAGWAPGQLDAEVARGDWFVIRAELDAIFDRKPEATWPRLIQENSGLPVRWQPDDGLGRRHRGAVASAPDYPRRATSWSRISRFRILPEALRGS